jgi:hypothetical protein
MNPKHVYTRELPRLGHLKVFGCLAYIHVPKVGMDKLEPRAIKGILLGTMMCQKHIVSMTCRRKRYA